MIRLTKPCYVGAVLFTLLAGSPLGAQAPADPPKNADAALAMRMCAIAQDIMRARPITSGHTQVAVALLEGACRLDPDEPRYRRLLAFEAVPALEAGPPATEPVRTIEALEAYRKLQPDDQVAQVTYIRAQLQTMQSLDKRMDYLKAILERRDAIPREVCSFVAYQAAKLQLERGSTREASEVLADAIRLNPVNREALALRYTISGPTATPLERLSMLLAQLRANPSQPEIVTTVARELAAAGLAEESLHWFERGVTAFVRAGVQIPSDVLRDYAAELFIADRMGESFRILGAMNSLDNEGTDAPMLFLLMQHQNTNGPDYKKNQAIYHNALMNKLARVRASGGIAGAATQPVDGAWINLPNIDDDLTRFKRAERPDILAAYADVLADLAWSDVYFNAQADNARYLLGKLGPILGEDNPLIVRIAGWCYLIEGRREEARTKLSAVAAQDPLAALGMLYVAGNSPDDRAKAAAEGAKLFAAHPAGVTGAFIRDAVTALDVKLHPPAYAQPLLAEVGRFPEEWWQLIEAKTPDAFYKIRADVDKPVYLASEPIFATVSIENVGTYPLTVGDDGVLHPTFFVFVQAVGLLQRPFNVTVERMSGRLVLQPGEHIETRVRLDQEDLSAFLGADPGPRLHLSASVMVNPTALPGGQFMTGAAGKMERFVRPIERAGVTLNDQWLRQMTNAALAGDPDERIRAIDLLARFAESRIRQNDPKTGTICLDVVLRSIKDEDPSVSAYARAQIARLVPQLRQTAVNWMLKDTHWQNRLLGVVAAAASPDLLKQVANDDKEDPLVRRCAAGMIILAQSAATRPSSQPSTAPLTPGTLPTQPVSRPAEPLLPPSLSPLTPETPPTPATTPVEPPVAPPVEPPVVPAPPPVTRPIEPPVLPPATRIVEPPVAPPLPPVTRPVEPLVEPVVAPPVTKPVEPPVVLVPATRPALPLPPTRPAPPPTTTPDDSLVP